MGSKQQIPPSILVQQKIRENATDVQNFLSDLSNWSKEMRATELALSNKPIPDVPVQEESTAIPLRNDPKTKNKKVEQPPHPPKPKTGGSDYTAWEKFDAEKACEEVEKKDDVTTKKTGDRVESESDLIRRRAIELKLKKMANEKKDLGNQCLKDKEYEKAVDYYTEGIRCDKKSAVLYANRAQANIFLKQYRRAVEDCSESILIDGTYVKAYFRRAKARFHLGKLLDAKNDLNKMLDLDRGNVEAKQLMNEINKKTMQCLLSTPGSQPPNTTPTTTPDDSLDNGRLSYFPGVTTRLLGNNNYNSLSGVGSTGGGAGRLFRPSQSLVAGYDDDYEEEDLRGGGDTGEIYPKIILPITKSVAKRSKRPLLPLHVKVIGRKGHGDAESKKKMRLDLLDCNGNDDQDEVIVSSSSSPSNSVISSSSMTSVSSPPASSNYAATPATPIATTTNHLHSLFSQLQMTSPPPKPSTSAQFELDWRKLKGNSDIAAQYLNQLSVSDYPTMFGESLEYRRLSEILELLLWEFLPRGWPVQPHLQGLASVRRFSTVALFMSEKDKANARKLISEVSSQEERTMLNKSYALLG